MKTLICALAALAFLPSAAGAATISAADVSWQSKYSGGTSFVATLVDDSGSGVNEANAIEIRIAPDQSVSARDLRTPLAAGRGCVSGDAGWVTCANARRHVLDFGVRLGAGDDELRVALDQAPGPFAVVRVDAGDGDDRVSAAGLSRATLVGGFGNDLLIGSDGDDFLFGGAGDDDLRGGAGDDTLLGDDGSNERYLPAASAFADRLDGGPGRDLATYYPVPTPLTADLAVGTATTTDVDGTPVSDRLTSIERLQGTTAADVLLGSEGDDELDGWGGGDTLDGRGGNDVLLGDQAAAVRCGTGADVLPATKPAASLPFPGPDCERIVSPVTTYTGLVRGDSSLHLIARVANTVRTSVCAVRATVVRPADRGNPVVQTTVRVPTAAAGR